jgi:hypothetical protein
MQAAGFETTFVSPRLVPVAHISLYHAFLSFHPDIHMCREEDQIAHEHARWTAFRCHSDLFRVYFDSSVALLPI